MAFNAAARNAKENGPGELDKKSEQFGEFWRSYEIFLS
jgi:hypothetical protein